MFSTMSFLTALAAVPAVKGYALPSLHVRQDMMDIPINASLPNVTIFATGGTIAGSANSNTATSGYTAGAIAVQALIDAVPELLNISNVAGVQVSNVASGNINDTILLTMNREITETLAMEDNQGAVVTHGTDTLEETAFFLDLTVPSKKPVVIVGAMRPATAISADGPLNLYQAVTLAAAEEAVGRGAMITLNDRIGSAFYVQKTHANALDTFDAPEQGYLGFFLNQIPQFYYETTEVTAKPFFDIYPMNLTSLPQVDILYSHQDQNPALINASIASGAEGIVFAGVGAGGITSESSEVAESLYNSTGVPMVFSTRTMNGFVSSSEDSWDIGAADLNPQKARIMLQLALATGHNTTEIKSLFYGLQSHSTEFAG